VSELSPEARALIAQARKQGPSLLGPSAEERARLRERLSPRWAAEREPPVALGPGKRLVAMVSVLAGLACWAWLQLTHVQPVVESTAALRGADLGEGLGRASVAHSVALTGWQPVYAERSARVEASAPLRAPAAESKRVASNHAAVSGARPALRSAPLQPSASPSAPVAHSGAPAQDARASRAQRSLDAAAGSERAAQDARGGARPSPEQTRAAGVPTKALSASADVAGRDHSGTVQAQAKPLPPSIDGELTLLAEAQAALQAEHPSRALKLLQEVAFRFPAGALREERMAMQALALCALQRRQAAHSILRDLEGHGSSSPLLPRVRKQCGL
jgi:hypothetical protein